MPRSCTVCRHHDREAVERALLAGEPFRHIAERFDTSTGALQRHRADHIPASLVQAQGVKEICRADTLLDDVRAGGDRAERLYNSAELILERALEAKDLKTALAAINGAVNVMREGRAYLELRGEITGELHPPEPPPPIVELPILLMPKTEEAARIERERLDEFYPRVIKRQDLKNAVSPVQPRRLEPAFESPFGEDEVRATLSRRIKSTDLG